MRPVQLELTNFGQKTNETVMKFYIHQISI